MSNKTTRIVSHDGADGYAQVVVERFDDGWHWRGKHWDVDGEHVWDGPYRTLDECLSAMERATAIGAGCRS